MQPGDVVATRAQDHGDVGNLQDAAVVLRADRAPPSQSAATDLSNVIPFVRSRRTGAEPAPPPVIVGPDDRPAAPPPGTGVVRQVALLVCSLAIHSALVFTFWEEPRPLASIGIEAITVEILVGDNRPAGRAPTPGESEAQPTPVTEEVKPDDRPVEQEQQRTAEVSEVKTEEKQAETAAEQPAEKADEQQPDTRQAIAMTETPQAETPTALPRETPPDMSAVIAPPRDEPKEVKPVEPKAKQPTPKKTEQKKEEKKKAARPAPTTPSDAASGAGKRSVASDPNYRGLVAAHLARHKQYPASARSSGSQGAGTVTFSISGSGSVTSVRVVRGTGSGVLDQELAAMVRRASPFPAPPGGQSMTFTVPVSWRLN